MHPAARNSSPRILTMSKPGLYKILNLSIHDLSHHIPLIQLAQLGHHTTSTHSATALRSPLISSCPPIVSVNFGKALQRASCCCACAVTRPTGVHNCAGHPSRPVQCWSSWKWHSSLHQNEVNSYSSGLQLPKRSSATALPWQQDIRTGPSPLAPRRRKGWHPSREAPSNWHPSLGDLVPRCRQWKSWAKHTVSLPRS